MFSREKILKMGKKPFKKKSVKIYHLQVFKIKLYLN